MDVACAVPDGLGKNRIGQTHDRRFTRQILQRCHLDFFFVRCGFFLALIREI